MSDDGKMVFRGRVWVVGDNINTDLILPIQAYYLTVAEQPKWVFSANRPGWSDQVQKGDILIGGKNFRHGVEPAGGALAQESGACLRGGRVDQRPILPECRQLRLSGARGARRVDDVPGGRDRGGALRGVPRP
jgi:hypothetical protein